MLVKVKFLKEIEYAGEVISVDKLPVQAKLPTYSKFGDACMDVYADRRSAGWSLPPRSFRRT